MSKELTGWRRKAVLLFKSEKRLGAKQVMSHYAMRSFDDMKSTLITDETGELADIPNVPRIKSLSGHLDKIKKEFIGESELCYYHATLVVLLRRDYKPEQTMQAFIELWETQTQFLLENLSLRWIVSACDTFVDYSNLDHKSSTIRASILMNVVTLINTLKVYETQRFLAGQQNVSILGQDHLNEENVDALYAEHLSLYEGLTYFRIGTDDTLKHMRERYQSFKTHDQLATTILLFVFDKLQRCPTAFHTVKELHTSDKSIWWEPKAES